MNTHIMLSKLKASDIPSPLAANAHEVKVVRDRDLEGFMVAKGIASGNRTYYSVRNATVWQGYQIADSIAAVRTLIGAAP